MDEKPKNYWQSTDQLQPAHASPTAGVTKTEDPLDPVVDRVDAAVSWRASEYIHHDKGVLWYVILSLVTIGCTAFAVFFQQWILAALLLVMGITIGIYARRTPREASYAITNEGIYVNNRLFEYAQFRSFGVVDEGAFFALQLRPIKRFAPGMTIYFAEADGEAIVDVLSEYLPIEEIHPDFVDTLMKWLRF